MSEFLLFFISLFSIVNPFSAIPTFVGLTGGVEARARRGMITRTAIAVFVILTTSYVTGEGLLGIVFATPGPGTGDAYLRFIPRTEMDIAVAGAGVSVTVDADGTCTAARVGIGAVAPTALLVPAAADALIGSPLDEAALVAAGAACSEASSPITDKRGTAEYRRKVVGVLCRRAAARAAERARENRR